MPWGGIKIHNPNFRDVQNNTRIRLSSHWDQLLLQDQVLTSPWHTVLFGKSLVTEVVMKCHAFTEPKASSSVYKNPPSDSILSQFDPIHNLTAYLAKVSFSMLLLHWDFPITTPPPPSP
jgi:hypothetical protein